ncbi:integrase core domain-containing protein [Saccharopolyspora shandongensis]|uniref:integrase core domain-containing protein n=1 Tax=Saccharopolyspora shandongensis TaxID=418495 RepID=UPI000AE73819|nr:integrase core domain-containing protein [Saccharopolyspora shandongensis]
MQHGLHRALNEHDRAATAYGGGEKPSNIIYPQSKQTMLPRPIESAQYTSAEFRATLAGLGVRPSVGRTGSCYDNAVAESFFSTLKAEIGTTVWATREDARRDVFSYLGYHNYDRLHSTLAHRTPRETRVSYRQSLALVA